MATIGLPDKRILKQLLQTVYVLAVCAIVEALQTSYIFYRHARWKALVVEVLKIGFLVIATAISTSKRFNKVETVPTKTSLVLGMILMMVSIASDLLLLFHF